jgi:hypothetical protein
MGETRSCDDVGQVHVICVVAELNKRSYPRLTTSAVLAMTNGMNMNMTQKVLAAVVFALATACGEDTGDNEEGGDTTFACEYITCDSAKGEFCWFQRYPTGEVHSATCMAPAAACTTCACAEEAVAAELDGSINCNSLTSCSQEGEAITYSCDNPRI